MPRVSPRRAECLASSVVGTCVWQILSLPELPELWSLNCGYLFVGPQSQAHDRGLLTGSTRDLPILQDTVDGLDHPGRWPDERGARMTHSAQLPHFLGSHLVVFPDWQGPPPMGGEMERGGRALKLQCLLVSCGRYYSYCM